MKKEIALPVNNEFPPVFDEHCRILILGSLPSEASRAAGFYYMNPRNRFWKMMSRLLGCDMEAMTAEEKAAALTRHGIALSDVILSCEIHRSSDASIKKVLATDIPAILAHSEVTKILLNGNKAYELFLRFFPQYAPLARKMPSTSPANAKIKIEELAELWGKELSDQR